MELHQLFLYGEVDRETVVDEAKEQPLLVKIALQKLHSLKPLLTRSNPAQLSSSVLLELLKAPLQIFYNIYLSSHPTPK